MKKRIFAFLLALVMVMSLVGCGAQKSETPKADDAPSAQAPAADAAVPEDEPAELIDVSFRLNYAADGLHAPFYLALEKGYYEEVGLNVTIGEGTGSGVTARLIGTGDDDIGLTDSASVASAIAEGIPIKIIAPIYAVNGFAAICMADSGIETPKDLEGKKVGIATGDGPSNLMAAVVAANDIDNSKITYIAMDPNAKERALMQGDVDCILAGADSDAVMLKNQGYDVHVMRWSDYGAATVGLSLVANTKMIENNPEVLEKFISATMRAWNECRTDYTEAMDIFLEHYPTLDRKTCEGGLDVALDSLFAADSKTLADLSEEDWETCRELLVNYLGLPATLEATDLYTYDCLPDDLPAR